MPLQDKLYQLFLLDKQVRGMRGRLDAALRREKVQRTRLDQARTQHRELAEQLKQAQSHAATLENEANAVELRIDKQRQQMNSAKNNKEYSALLVEVNTLKIEKGKLEDTALEHLAKVDEFKKKTEDAATRSVEQEKLVGVAQHEVETARAEVGQQLEELQRQRAAAAQDVAPETRAIFNRLADDYEGEALAPVIEENRRRMEYTCGGCYMGIPAERVNTLMTKRDELVQCPACRRILYLEASLRESISTAK
jgi:predicted  nucleic acid-binding Zn-ribbon protein